MNILNKYLFLSIEKYKAVYSQQKSTGQLFFEIHVSATKNDLKKESEEAIKICSEVCSNFNKHLIMEDKKKTKKTDIKTIKV